MQVVGELKPMCTKKLHVASRESDSQVAYSPQTFSLYSKAVVSSTILLRLHCGRVGS